MTHGWPGSVVELLETIGPLTDPTAHGGNPEDAFDLVPSLPGYGFSAEPTELGWDASRKRAELMHRLGYSRYVAQGGDVGRLVTDLMGRQAVEGLVGYHLNLLTAVLAIGEHLPKDSEQERRGRGVRHVQAGRLRLLPRRWRRGHRRSATPCWTHPSRWRPGCSTTTRTATTRSRAFVDGEPVGNLTRDTIVDNITLYWLTGTAASAARSYWETHERWPQRWPAVSLPRRSRFRSASRRSPARSGPPAQLAEAGLAYFNEVDRGGHFAAWEEPQLFTEELRAAFKSLR